MLTPFRGLLPPAGLSAEETTRRARALRSERGRYQHGDDASKVDLAGWRRAEEPVLYRYEMARGGATITGVVGEVGLDHLVPHEGTIESEPLTPRPTVEITPILALSESTLPDLEVVGDPVWCDSPDGWRHTVTPVRGAPVEGAGRFVIADGHHRHLAAARAAERADGDDRILTMVVGDGGAGLEGGAFHRVFPSAPALPRSLGAFEVFEADPEPRAGVIVWCGPSGAVGLRPRPEALETIAATAHSVMPLVARRLLYPELGLSEEDARYAPSVAQALEEMGDGSAALMPRVELSQVIASARAGEVMPPKSTRFRPKPARGLVVRLVGASSVS